METLYSVLDHLVYATPDLEATVERLADLFGVRAALGGHHEAWRTRNALLSLGERTYLEIMGADETGRAPGFHRPFDLDNLTAPRLVTWVARSSDIHAARDTARLHGVDLGELQERSRQKPDGSVLRWTMTDLTKAREGGVIPYFIDWGDSAHPSESSPRGCTLVTMKVVHPDANRIRRTLSSLGLDVPVEAGPNAAVEALLQTPKGRFKLD